LFSSSSFLIPRDRKSTGKKEKKRIKEEENYREEYKKNLTSIVNDFNPLKANREELQKQQQDLVK